MKSIVSRRRWSAVSLIELSQYPADTLEPGNKALVPLRHLTKEDFFPATPVADDDIEKSKWVIHPESSWKLVWDIINMMTIFYQAVTVPFFLAFTVTDTETWSFIDDAITVFYITDMAFCFNTAYYQGGAVIASRKQIAKNYLKLWFWVDLFTTFPYDTVISMSSGKDTNSSYSSAAKLLRILKFNRILRLIRLAKLKKILIEVEDYISSHYIANLLVFVRLVVFAFFIAHWTACIWYYIALNDSETHPQTWLNTAYMESTSNTEVYITALYWAFTTMATVGYGDIYPITNNEIIFAIIAMAVACGMFAYTVGSIGGLVSKHSAEENVYREQCVAINAYMKDKKLSNDLKFRVRRYLDYIWENLKQSMMGENEILALLSEPLREEIFVHTRGQTLNICRLFSNFQKHFLLQLTKLLEPKTFAPNDSVFEEGEKSTTLYFIQNGIVELYHHDTQSIFKELRADNYFGEIALFTFRPRCCSARCLEFVETLSLSREKMDSLLDRNPEAAKYCDYIYKQCQDGDLSILQVVCYLCGEIGHVSPNCKRVLLNFDNEILKKKWLNSRSGESVSVNPYELQANRRARRVKALKYMAANVVGSERDPSILYNENPALTKKISKYLDKGSLSGILEPMTPRPRASSFREQTRPVVDHILNMTEPDIFDEDTSPIRTDKFDRSLITAKGASGNGIKVSKISQILGNEDEFEFDSNPQEPKQYLRIPQNFLGEDSLKDIFPDERVYRNSG